MAPNLTARPLVTHKLNHSLARPSIAESSERIAALACERDEVSINPPTRAARLDDEAWSRLTSRKNSAPVRRGPLLSSTRRSPVWGGRPRPPNRPRPICLPLPFLPP